MKNIAVLLAIAIVLVSAGLVYSQAMEVVDISDDVVTVSTSTGILFAFEGAEDYEVGDIVAVTMFSNGTAIVTDDVILAVRSSGFVKGELK